MNDVTTTSRRICLGTGTHFGQLAKRKKEIKISKKQTENLGNSTCSSIEVTVFSLQCEIEFKKCAHHLKTWLQIWFNDITACCANNTNCKPLISLSSCFLLTEQNKGIPWQKICQMIDSCVATNYGHKNCGPRLLTHAHPNTVLVQVTEQQQHHRRYLSTLLLLLQLISCEVVYFLYVQQWDLGERQKGR